MSADRIPCPKCGSLILEVTAKYNDGLCAPCHTTRTAALYRRQQEEARRNAPPPPINYSFFTRKQFVQALANACLPYREDPGKVSGEFLAFCDPVLQRPSILFLLNILLHRWWLYRNLTRLPRPYRELMAVYQAWGMVSSDGFESYIQSTIPRFDAEVDRGLALLGCETGSGVVSEARQVCRENDGEIPKEIDNEFWKRFYDSMPEFESAILGSRLIAELAIADQGANAKSE